MDGFDRHVSFSFSDIGLGRNVIISGVDMSSSTKIDNKKRDTLILGKRTYPAIKTYTKR